MEDNSIILTITESTNLPQMEREAYETSMHIENLQDLVILLWNKSPIDFKKSIALMETCRFLGYNSVAELIEIDLKEWRPAYWQQYQASLRSDVSCADGNTNER